MRKLILKVGGVLVLFVLVGCENEDDAQTTEKAGESVSQGVRESKAISLKEGSLKLKSTGRSKKVEEKDGQVTVTTDRNAHASYQLSSETLPVQAGDKIKVSYKITLQPEGRISLGLLNTKRNGWYGPELILATDKDAKAYEGVYERVVPEGEKETSLVFRNYHLHAPGQSTFTIEDLGLKIN